MINLYEHNKAVYEELRNTLLETNKIVVVAATGVGKTYIMMKYLEDYYNEHNGEMVGLVLSPSKNIVNEHRKYDCWDDSWGSNLDYVTFQSLITNIDCLYHGEFYERIKNLDILMVDEAHRLGAREWRKAYERLLELNPNLIVIGFTATPLRYTDNGMNIVEEFFDGRSVGNISLSDAISKGLVNKPVLVRSVYDVNDDLNALEGKLIDSTLTETYKNSLYSKINRIKINFKSIDLTNIVHRYLCKYRVDKNGKNNIKLIVFCAGIKHIEECKETVKSWFDTFKMSVETHELYTGVNDKKVLDSFKAIKENTIDLLFCVDKMNEGLHLDDLDGVILLRNTLSPIVFYQQIGRVISANNKDKTTIIFDFVNNTESIKEVESKQFSYVGGKNKTNKKDNKDTSKIGRFKGLKYTDVTLYDETKDIYETLKEIEIKIYHNISWYQDNSDATWLKNLKDLVLFIQTKKRLPNNSDSGILYSWLVLQKSLNVSNSLTEWRKEKLIRLKLLR